MITSRQIKFSSFIFGMIASVVGIIADSQSFAADNTETTSPPVTYGPLVVADAHSYRHCHNLSKRTYCHKADRLPQNWPPNSNTPHRSGSESGVGKDCLPLSRRCPSNTRYGKG